MPGNVQADRCRHLIFLLVGFIAAALCVLVTCRIGFADPFICLVADTRVFFCTLCARRLHALALHDIGRKGRVRISLVVFAAAVLIQCLVDLLIGLSRLFPVLIAAAAFFAVILLSEKFTGEQLVGGIFGSLCALCKFVQIPVDIGAHSRGQRFAVVTVKGICAEAGLAGCLQAAAHDCLHAGICDVDRHARADCRRFAGCKGTALGNGPAILTGGQVETHMFRLRICLIDCDRIGSGDFGDCSCADLCEDIIADDGDRHGRIQCHILFGFRLLVRSSSARQRIRARHAGRLRIMYRYGADVHCTGFHTAVFADSRFHIQTAVCHGKACADADRLAACRLVFFFA